MNTRGPLLLCSLSLTVAALAAPGDVDLTFNPQPNVACTGTAIQPDGRRIISGDFSVISGAARGFMARYDASDVLEAGFNPNVSGGSQNGVFGTAVLADGKLIIAGWFSSAGGQTRANVARLLPGGAVDTGFSQGLNNQLRGLAVQRDGRLIVTGQFTSAGGAGRNRIARFLPDGSLDTTYNPNANDTVRSVALQADGRAVYGGNFTTIAGVVRNHLARVHADGTLDAAFNPNVTGNVYAVAVQADGRILLGGSFTAVGGVARSNLARINATGTVDTTFNPGTNGLVRGLTLQTDGAILLAGEFTAAGGITRNYVARLHADGMLDAVFNPNANALCYGTDVMPDGRIMLAGEFSAVGGVARRYCARLLNGAATQSLTVPSAARVQWLRGGASPETHQVTFELSTSGGGSWSPLNAATRIAGGWELDGLALLPTGMVRARARTAGGFSNACAGLTETILSYDISPLALWRQTNFGTLENSGPAANNEDPDKDGLENLVEFAFGRNPNTPDAAALPEWQLEDDDYSLTFTSPAGVSGITYTGEYSTSMAPGSWTPAVNVSTPPEYHFLAPAITQRLYLRVRVTGQ